MNTCTRFCIPDIDAHSEECIKATNPQSEATMTDCECEQEQQSAREIAHAIYPNGNTE
jgi:hypothetical protein